MGHDVNEVLVPTYMIESASKVLKTLADVCNRPDLHMIANSGRMLSKQLAALPEAQSSPRGERLAIKAHIPKRPPNHYFNRGEDMREVFAAKVMPEFHRLNEQCKGRVRFTIFLTWVAD